jgi:hypothetical protein
VGLLVRVHTDHHTHGQPPMARCAPGRRKLQGNLVGSSPGVGSRVRSLPAGGSNRD